MIVASVHRPRHDDYPGVAVVETFGHMGNVLNSTPRLDMTAALGNVTIIGMQREGTRTTVIDLGMRRRLHPARYNQTMADQVEDIRQAIMERAGEFNSLAGHGVSAGGAPTSALALAGLFRRGVLMRDAIKVDGPQGALPGIRQFITYKEHGKPEPPADAPRVPDAGEVLSAIQKHRQKATEMWYYYPLLLSVRPADNVRQLAANPHLPLYVVGYGHTFVSPIDEVEAYVDDLGRTRRYAIEAMQAARPNAKGAGFAGLLEPNLYHSDLVARPDIAARDIRAMLALDQAA